MHKSNSNHLQKIFAQDPSSIIQNFKCMQLQGNSPEGGGEECHRQQRTSEFSWHSADSVSCQLWSWSQKKTAELLFFLNTSQTGSKAFDKLRRGLSCQRPYKGHGLAALAQRWALQVTILFYYFSCICSFNTALIFCHSCIFCKMYFLSAEQFVSCRSRVK